MDREERRKQREEMVARRLATQGDWLARSIEEARGNHDNPHAKREAGHELMQIFCDRQELGPIEPELLAYFADSFREILNGEDPRDALNIRNRDKGRPSNWSEQLEWAIKVQGKINFGQKRTQAIEAVSDEIHKGSSNW